MEVCGQESQGHLVSSGSGGALAAAQAFPKLLWGTSFHAHSSFLPLVSRVRKLPFPLDQKGKESDRPPQHPLPREETLQ